MRRISVSNVEKIHKGTNVHCDYIRSLNHKCLLVPMPHALFEQIKATVSDYIYIVRFTGMVWRKTKRKDYYEYYDEDTNEWLFDDETDSSDIDYMDWGETLNRFVK